ncbi:precorrin-2 dehydrogenase/sirohydrochlorin ferrochelatase [Paenibacillus phyllosphaerae]|uniref:precorrin-2 dehydrogenase n=1 Tax=Paenibacillus phyllosphaerae TaxID=274593 RepID=A0A7W5AWP8_9BACL|nr:bifunctional precorrin-2 dehydrogenase/sirohydrochlorin ferrochelatase [Paenibacillus phyllosphaerae]MBB3109884.1 precorrin-2 dehydrogenase/sirohydrochlorin ferrochelatase [Paenibacillus phyllosphaerae]
MGAMFPIMVDLRGKRCVVIGGGRIAERKIRSLLEAGGDQLVVVSLQHTTELERLAAIGSIRIRRREYIEEDLLDARFVFAATDNPSVNARVLNDCKKRGILVNMAEHADQGDFAVPAVVRRGDLVLSVSTSGSSPAMAIQIRKELERRYGEAYAEGIARLGALRAHVQEVEPDPESRKRLLREASLEMEERMLHSQYDFIPEEDPAEWLNRIRIAASRRHEE